MSHSDFTRGVRGE